MIKRIILFSTACRISLSKGQLYVKSESGTVSTIPCEDVGLILLEHPSICITRCALSECISNNTAVIVCDERHMPVAVLQSYEGNSLCAQTLRRQSKVPKVTMCRVWRTIVQQKISNQALLLDHLDLKCTRLGKLVREVTVGDRTNIEAQAARLYWRKLFGSRFRRGRRGGGVNVLLNYGYAVFRAMTARAITMAGLHPALGIHHCNQYNAFAFADDLLEPLRPIVDHRVNEMIRAAPECEIRTLAADDKKQLLELCSMGCQVRDRSMPLMVAMQLYVASVKRALFEKSSDIRFPEYDFRRL